MAIFFYVNNYFFVFHLIFIGYVESKVVTEFEFASLMNEIGSNDEGIFSKSKFASLVNLVMFTPFDIFYLFHFDAGEMVSVITLCRNLRMILRSKCCDSVTFY